MKKLVLLGLMLSINMSHAISIQSMKEYFTGASRTTLNFAKKAAVCTGLVAVPYLIGRGSSAVVLKLAHRRFNREILYVHTAQITGDYTLFLGAINAYYNQQINTVEVNENNALSLFPLIRYKNDLDWYINTLWCLQLFQLGTNSHQDMQQMISDLTTVRDVVTSQQEFTEQTQRLYLIQQRYGTKNKQ